MVLNNNQTQNITEEIETLKKEYEKNEKDIKDLAQKVKYIDISVIDIINKELIQAKNKSEELKNRIEVLENSKTDNKKINTQLSKGSKYILNIINNCFDTFEAFDLKTKKDILNLFVESAYGEGDTIEINLLNTKISENQKKMICNQLLSSGKGCRCSNDISLMR